MDRKEIKAIRQSSIFGFISNSLRRPSGHNCLQTKSTQRFAQQRVFSLKRQMFRVLIERAGDSAVSLSRLDYKIITTSLMNLLARL